MTLNDILTAALAQLDRGHDPQTMEAYRRRLIFYANEAQNDLARAIGFCRTDEATPVNGIVRADSLPRVIIKLKRAEQLGHAVRFTRGDTGEIALPYCEPAKLTYICEPKPLVLPQDVSELPAQAHSLIVSYIVARERMSGDVSTQRGANVYLSMYEAGKAKLRPHYGDGGSYTILNRY